MLLKHQMKQELKTSFGFSYIKVTVNFAGVLREWWGGNQTGKWVENEEHNWRSSVVKREGEAGLVNMELEDSLKMGAIWVCSNVLEAATL